MLLNDYNQIIREHFDISDARTRKTIVSLDEAEQTQLLSALTNALYDKIVDKVSDIDFGSIPSSRGDITKVEGFENTVECLNIIRRLILEYHENPEIVDTVLTAIENIKSRKSQFTKAYALNIEFPMVLYNLIVLAIEQSVSFLIAVTIQYIKDPASGDINVALDKVGYNNTKDNLLYEQLYKFNKACATGDTDAVLKDIFKNGGQVSEGFNASNSSEVSDAGAGVNTIVINVGKSIGGINKNKPHSPFQEFPDEDKCDGSRPDEIPCSGTPDCQCPKCKSVIMGCGDGVDCVTPPEQPVDEALGTAAIGTTMMFGKLGAAGTVAVGAGLTAISFKIVKFMLHCFIPIMRSVVYYYYNSRVKFSEYLSIQSQFIEANAYKLQFSTVAIDDTKKTKIVQKQLKWAEKLKAFSNKVSIDNKKAEKAAKKMAQEDMKKIKVGDVENELPADIVAKSVLF